MKISPQDVLKVMLLPVVACLALGAVGRAQQPKPEELPQAPTPNPSVMTLAGDVKVERATPGTMPLSIDEAIDLGLKRNLGILLQVQNQRLVHGQVLTVKNNLLPSLTAVAKTSAQQVNLAALGFKPGKIDFTANFPTIVKVDVTSAQMNLSQQLFNVPAYYLYRAAQKADDVASWSMLNQRGTVALNVGTQYLRAVADASQIDNAKALLKADEVALNQATASHDAGVGTNLDVLRARVQ